jgi:hypothetical protein
MTHQEVALNLLESVEDDTNKNQEGGSTIETCE